MIYHPAVKLKGEEMLNEVKSRLSHIYRGYQSGEKIITLKKILVLPILLSSLLISNCSSDVNSDTNLTDENQSVSGIDLNSFQYQDLSPEEIDGLIFMREEEKLARDVYNHLYKKWELRVFNNIAQSEQRHTDAIKALINKYELDDPVKDDIPGAFLNEDLQNLYDTLIEKGDSSLVDALLAGALIEEVDIIDIQKEIDEHVDNEDVAFVYDNLINGSYNHLRAFVRNLSRRGILYEPKLLSDEKYNSIVNNN